MKFPVKRLSAAALFAALSVLPAASPARAAGFWDWLHHPVVYTKDYFRWPDEKFEPYLDNGTQAQNTQWDNSSWTADDWIRQDRNGLALVHRFYVADIIRRQYVHDQTKVLVVGPAFYQLGGQDKRRVMAVVDRVWKVTSSTPSGMFMLYDWQTKKPVGAYMKDGLEIQ